MTKLTTILLAGVATLAFTACGGGDSGSSSSYTAPVEDTNTIPLSVNGNQILVPGYVYDSSSRPTFEMYVAERGNVLFTSPGCYLYAYDANYNKYITLNGSDYIYEGTHEFGVGQYYITIGACGKGNPGTLTVQSNVLIVPQ